MSVFFNVTRVSILLGAMISFAAAQGQQEPVFTYDYCVKVKPGKWGQYSDFLEDVTAKMAQVRIDERTLAAFGVGRAVIPAGTAARCDYHILFSFNGWPPEGSPEKTEEVMKKAGLTMTREEMIGQRNEYSYLVSVDMWRRQASAGRVAKGSYVRLNYYRVKEGMVDDWIQMESQGWQKLVETALNDHPGIAWGASTLTMPAGSDLEYNAVTFDGFPDWEALGRGIPVRPIWIETHPEQDLSAYLDEINSLLERPRIDVIKMVEVLRVD